MEGTLTKAPARPAFGGGAAASGGARASGSSGGAALRFLKFALALAALPICVGASQSLYEIVRSAWTQAGAEKHAWVLWFGGGAGAFGAVCLLWRPVIIYVFGHELMHALATWLCLGSVSNFKASSTGGSVTSSKSNTLIRLAPYCVPIYALLVAGTYLELDHWLRPLHAQLHWVMAALGFFYAFHLGFTIWSIRRDQPDLKPDGWIFSLTVIYLANLAVFALLLGFVMTGEARYAWPALHAISLRGWQHSLDWYQHIGGSLRGVYERYALK